MSNPQPLSPHPQPPTPHPDSAIRNPQSAIRTHLAVLLGFLALGVLATWPLALHFTTAVTGADLPDTRFDLADQDATLWAQWWVFDALFRQHSSPFVSNLLY